MYVVKTIDRIKVSLNPKLNLRGILLTMFDKRNKLSSQVDKEARNYFKEKVYQTVIPRNVRLSEPSHGMPCVLYDKSCVGSKSYYLLSDEFLKQHREFGTTDEQKKGLFLRIIRGYSVIKKSIADLHNSRKSK